MYKNITEPSTVVCFVAVFVALTRVLTGIYFSECFPTLTLKGGQLLKGLKDSLSCVKSPQHLPRGLINSFKRGGKRKRTDTLLLQSHICLTPSYPPFKASKMCFTL